MTWTRRRFVVGMSLGAFAPACNQASSDDKTASPPAPRTGPAKPSQNSPRKPPVNFGYPLRTPYNNVDRMDATYDGDELLLLRNQTVVRLDAKLVEKTRIPVKGVYSFALLPDRSLVVVTSDSIVHVVNDKVVSSQPTFARRVRSLGSSTEFWGLLLSDSVARTKFGDPKLPPSTTSLPANTHIVTAETLADGALVVDSNDGIRHIDQTITLYKWDQSATILSRGPEPMTVWVNVGHDKLVLAKLEKEHVVVKATYAMRNKDQLVHSTSNGTLAGGIVAHPISTSEAAFTLVVWDAKKERFRVPLDNAPYLYRFVVMSDKRIAALADSPGKNIVVDLATGEPI